MTAHAPFPPAFWPSPWTAVADSRDLKTRPIRIVIDDQPIVLFRADGGLCAISDICPHRFASLSQGKVIGDQIECPYHGWRFDGQGQCRDIPGLIAEQTPRLRTRTYAVREAGGIIFVAPHKDDGPPPEPYVTALNDRDTIRQYFHHAVRAQLADVADNILDTAHTHYVHKGLLRGLSAKRTRVRATITAGDGWVEARYDGENHQTGIINGLLEGYRSVGIGRFIYPGIVELEYWGRDIFGRERMTMACTFHLRQETREMVRGLGILSGPREGGLGYLKAVLFRPLFALGVEQDRAMLHSCSDNRALLAEPKIVNGPLDLLRPHIDAILAGQRPSIVGKPQVVEMAL